MSACLKTNLLINLNGVIVLYWERPFGPSGLLDFVAILSWSSTKVQHARVTRATSCHRLKWLILSHSVAAVLEYNFEFKSQCPDLYLLWIPHGESLRKSCQRSARAAFIGWGQEHVFKKLAPRLSERLCGLGLHVTEVLFLMNLGSREQLINCISSQLIQKYAFELKVLPETSEFQSNTNGSNNYKHYRRWRGMVRGEDKYWITHRTAAVIKGIVIHKWFYRWVLLGVRIWLVNKNKWRDKFWSTNTNVWYPLSL